MPDEKRFPVPLTEAEINALVCTVKDVKIGSVHACRIKAVHTGLGELKQVQMDISIANE